MKSPKIVLFRSYDTNDEGVVFTASERSLRVPHALLEQLGDGAPVNALVLARTSAAQVEAEHGPAPDELGMDD